MLSKCPRRAGSRRGLFGEILDAAVTSAEFECLFPGWRMRALATFGGLVRHAPA